MNTEYTVRKPTEDEWVGIIECLVKYWDVPEDNVDLKDSLMLSCASVVDGYITDTPNYAGKIFTIYWSGYPTFHTMIGWDKKEKYFMIFDYCDGVNFPKEGGE